MHWLYFFSALCMVIQVTATIQSDNEHDLFNVTDYNQEFKDTLCGQNVTIDDTARRCDCRETDYVGVQCMKPRTPCDKSACGYASDCTFSGEEQSCTCIEVGNYTQIPGSKCFNFTHDHEDTMLEYTPPFKHGDTILRTTVEMEFRLEYTNMAQPAPPSPGTFDVKIPHRASSSSTKDITVNFGTECASIATICLLPSSDRAHVTTFAPTAEYSNVTGAGNVTFKCKFTIIGKIEAKFGSDLLNLPFKIINAELDFETSTTTKKCAPDACNGFSAGCVKGSALALEPDYTDEYCFPMPNYELNTASHTFETTSNCNNTGYPLMKNGQPICDCSLIPEFTGPNCSEVQPLCTGIRNPCAHDSTFCKVNSTTENSYCECNRNYTASTDGTQTQLFGGDTCEIQYNHLQGKAWQKDSAITGTVFKTQFAPIITDFMFIVWGTADINTTDDVFHHNSSTPRYENGWIYTLTDNNGKTFIVPMATPAHSNDRLYIIHLRNFFFNTESKVDYQNYDPVYLDTITELTFTLTPNISSTAGSVASLNEEFLIDKANNTDGFKYSFAFEISTCSETHDPCGTYGKCYTRKYDNSTNEGDDTSEAPTGCLCTGGYTGPKCSTAPKDNDDAFPTWAIVVTAVGVALGLLMIWGIRTYYMGQGYNAVPNMNIA